MPALRVLFTIAGLHPESGGPSRSVPVLCEMLARQGVEVEIVSHHYGPAFAPPLTPPEPRVHTTFVNCSSPLCRRLQWSPQFKRVLRDRCRDFQPQIIHDTGLWLSTNHAAAVVASEMKLPRVVSPRGMLTGWALRHKGWKKRLAWGLYQRSDLQRARLLHATAGEEAQDFRNAALTQPITVLPNGVELPAKKVAGAPRGAGRKNLLFLSRLHPKKGLLNLVKAWQAARISGWQIIIAGGDERGHRAEVEASVRAAGLTADFAFIGSVEGPQRWGLYQNADLFVLPSHSENFGIVVAEALACGVPAIASRGTPWQELETHCCGWWPEDNAEALVAALRDATSRTDEERAEMGRRGRQLVEAKYGWPGIASQLASVYGWMLGQGARPDCVFD